MTVHMFTMSVNSLKYQFMSQAVNCSFIIYIDELVGYRVHIHKP